MPAVILLGENGQLEEILIPRDGNLYTKDIQTLFPEEIQKMGLSYAPFDSTEAEKHIDERLANGGPPLIVIGGVLLP